MSNTSRHFVIKYLVILFFFSLNTSAMYSKSSSDAMKEYYRLAHLGVTEVVKGNYEEAVKFYNKAFETIEYPMFTDLNNALYAACQTERPNREEIKKYFRAIQQKGVCIHERYKKFDVFEPFLTLADEQECRQVRDTMLRNTVKDAIACDQILRTFSHDTLKEYYHPNLLPAIDKIDSVNYYIVNGVMEHCLNQSVSLENLIGLEQAHSINIIYLHNAAWGRYDMEKMYLFSTSGIIDSRGAAHNFDRFCNSFYGEMKPGQKNKFSKEASCDPMYALFGTNALRQHNDIAFILFLNPTEEKKIFEQRNSFFLPDLYEDCKIRVYAYYHRQEGFFYPMIVNWGSYDIEGFEKSIQDWCPHYIKYSGAKDYSFDRK